MIPTFYNENKKQLFLFDMDGVCAEHQLGEWQKTKDNEKDFYINKRPIKSVIKVMKTLSKLSNVCVGILSSCNYQNQYEQKMLWLKKHVPFVKTENVFIVVWGEKTLNATNEEKGKQKGKIILNLQKQKAFDDIFLIEDRHDFMCAVNKLIPNCAHHFSEILD